MEILPFPAAGATFTSFFSCFSFGMLGWESLEGLGDPSHCGLSWFFLHSKMSQPLPGSERFGELALESRQVSPGLTFTQFVDPLGSEFWESQLQETLLCHALMGRACFFLSLFRFILRIPFFELFLVPLSS